jgi:hypothetical protein
MRPPVITPYNEPKKAKSRESEKKVVKRTVKRTVKKTVGKYENSALHSLYIDYTTKRNKVIEHEQIR